MKGRTIVLYGDIIFDTTILEKAAEEPRRFCPRY